MKIIDVLFLSVALSCTATVYAEYGMDKDVMDIGLIYQGGVHRPDWTQEELKPYVVHEYADGHKEWFFSSYLFLEFTNGSGVGYGTGYGTPAKKEDWEWLLDRIFTEDKGLDALDKCIEQYKSEIGDPGFRHKIVLGWVVPINGQTDWGDLNGKNLNFNVRSHRIEASEWYLDQLMTRFDNAGYKNLELVGFYCIEEDSNHFNGLTPFVSDYIHEHGYKFYWIPFFSAAGYSDWKELGFDLAFYQPNYFFNTNLHPSRVKDACMGASRHGLGLEMEWEYTVLYEDPESRYEMLETYIDTFEGQGVFDSSAIAYYSGTKTILQMYESEYIENTLILDRIVDHIVDRRENGVGGVDNVKSSGDLYVAGGEGQLLVYCESGDAKVYSVDGRIVAEGKGFIECPKGMYIVVSKGGGTKKVIVR